MGGGGRARHHRKVSSQNEEMNLPLKTNKEKKRKTGWKKKEQRCPSPEVPKWMGGTGCGGSFMESVIVWVSVLPSASNCSHKPAGGIRQLPRKSEKAEEAFQEVRDAVSCRLLEG